MWSPHGSLLLAAGYSHAVVLVSFLLLDSGVAGLFLEPHLTSLFITWFTTCALRDCFCLYSWAPSTNPPQYVWISLLSAQPEGHSFRQQRTSAEVSDRYNETGSSGKDGWPCVLWQKIELSQWFKPSGVGGCRVLSCHFFLKLAKGSNSVITVDWPHILSLLGNFLGTLFCRTFMGCLCSW